MSLDSAEIIRVLGGNGAKDLREVFPKYDEFAKFVSDLGFRPEIEESVLRNAWDDLSFGEFLLMFIFSANIVNGAGNVMYEGITGQSIA